MLIVGQFSLAMCENIEPGRYSNPCRPIPSPFLFPGYSLSIDNHDSDNENNLYPEFEDSALYNKNPNEHHPVEIFIS